MEYLIGIVLLIVMFFAWRQFYLTNKRKHRHGRK